MSKRLPKPAPYVEKMLSTPDFGDSPSSKLAVVLSSIALVVVLLYALAFQGLSGRVKKLESVSKPCAVTNHVAKPTPQPDYSGD